MQYCKRCLYPANHPLNIIFDAEGICSGCRIHEEKDKLDWAERFEKLKQVVKPYKANKRSIHDCIIPVSGARDSYFIVHVVKNLLGLHPLLVTYNKHYNTQIGIRNLAYLRTLLGCDLMTMTVSPERVKKITRESIRQRGSIYWHCLAGQTVFSVQIAVKFKIPLIIHGAHQGVDQVGMFSHLDEVEMTRKYRYEHDLMCLEPEELVDNAEEDLQLKDVEQFIYPHNKEIEAVGVRGIYLNNYIRWDTKTQHENMLKLYQYETAKQQRTFDTYNDVDCFHYSGLHDYIKFLKWGYGKVTDHASREIRLKHMSREQGIQLVNQFNNIVPKDTALFLNWVRMEEKEFWNYIKQFRDAKDWKSNQCTKEMHSEKWPTKNNVQYVLTGTKKVEKDEQYTLIGRGWVDPIDHDQLQKTSIELMHETV